MTCKNTFNFLHGSRFQPYISHKRDLPIWLKFLAALFCLSFFKIFIFCQRKFYSTVFWQKNVLWHELNPCHQNLHFVNTNVFCWLENSLVIGYSFLGSPQKHLCYNMREFPLIFLGRFFPSSEGISHPEYPCKYLKNCVLGYSKKKHLF